MALGEAERIKYARKAGGLADTQRLRLGFGTWKRKSRQCHKFLMLIPCMVSD